MSVGLTPLSAQTTRTKTPTKSKPAPKSAVKTGKKTAEKPDAKANYKWIELLHERGSVSGNTIRNEQGLFEITRKFDKVRFRWKVKLNGPGGNFHTSLARFNPGPAKYQTSNVITRVRSNEERSVTTRLPINKYRLDFKYQRVAMEFWVEAWGDPNAKAPQSSATGGTNGGAGTPVSTNKPEIKFDSLFRYSGEARDNRTGHTFKYFQVKKKYAKVRFSWSVKKLGAGFNLRVTLATLPAGGRKYQNLSVVCRTRQAGASSVLTNLPPGKYRLEFNYQRISMEFLVDGQPLVAKDKSINLETKLK